MKIKKPVAAVPVHGRDPMEAIMRALFAAPKSEPLVPIVLDTAQEAASLKQRIYGVGKGTIGIKADPSSDRVIYVFLKEKTAKAKQRGKKVVPFKRRRAS